MKKLVRVLASLLMIAFLISCGGSESYQKTDSGDIPDWYLNSPDNPNYIFAAATAGSKDLQLSVDKATADARTELGRQVEVRIAALQKSFNEEVGAPDNSTLLQQFTQTSKTVVSTSLSGSKVFKKEVLEDDDNYRAYVLVQYPIGAAQEEFLQQIKKNEELYTRYRSSQAFKELDEEVKKYEEWKKNNN